MRKEVFGETPALPRQNLVYANVWGARPSRSHSPASRRRHLLPPHPVLTTPPRTPVTSNALHVGCACLNIRTGGELNNDGRHRSTQMKCIKCEEEARAVCQFCGRAVCKQHIQKRRFMIGNTTKGAMSMGGNALSVEDAVWCGECKPEYHQTG